MDVELIRHDLRWVIPALFLLVVALKASIESYQYKSFDPRNGPGSRIATTIFVLGCMVGPVYGFMWVYVF
jgi:hypothetical protein